MQQHHADGIVEEKVNTITIKVLLFFKHAPETWFTHLEAQFDIKKITTSSTKFWWCISALPSDVSALLTNIIRDPGEDTYQDIKDRLIHLYSLSNHQKFETLINLPFPIDTMPSVLMSSMLNLYPKKLKLEFVFIGLFFSRLPQFILDHLLALDLDENTDALAKKADQLFQSHQASSLNPLTGLSSVFQGHSLLQEFSGRLQSISFCISSTSILLQLWYRPSYH